MLALPALTGQGRNKKSPAIARYRGALITKGVTPYALRLVINREKGWSLLRMVTFA